jgi:hypothetical protein
MTFSCGLLILLLVVTWPLLTDKIWAKFVGVGVRFVVPSRIDPL